MQGSTLVRGRRGAAASAALAAMALMTTAALAQAPKVGDPPEARNMRLVGIERSAGAQRLSADHPSAGRAATSPISAITAARPTCRSRSTAHRTARIQRHLDRRRDRSGAAEISRAHSGPGRQLRGRRRADGARLRRQDAAEGRSATRPICCASSAAQAHEIWDVSRSGQPGAAHARRERPQGHPQELVGVRHRHRLSRLRRAGLARAPHDRRSTISAIPPSRCKIRDFGLVGQEPGASGTVPTDLHGMISTGPQGNRVYFGYGTNKGGVLQIVDREKLLNGPKEPTPENLRYPGGRASSTCCRSTARTPCFRCGKMPVAEFAKDKDGKVRDFVMIVDEQILQRMPGSRARWCGSSTSRSRSKPMVVSNFSVPEASGNFCERGGRFGSHSSNESMAPVFYKKVAFVTYFNAGVRAVDIRNPYQPKEIGYFIPSITEATDKRCIKVDGTGPLQDRDPEQQRGNRRPRLHLRGRPRQYRHAHSRIDRRGAGGRGAAVGRCRAFDPICASGSCTG